jgi:MoaA/NifB/PqqE/SkfB family radical SAM enzyme
MMATGAKFLREHPAEALAHAKTVLPWYMHNRIRSMILPWEQNIWGQIDGRAQNPRFITIKPTFRCNLRCSFCRYVSNGQVFGGPDYFLDEEWINLVDEVAPHKPYFSITGGEPLIYPGLGRLLRRMKHHDLHVCMVTNATLLERKAEEIMDAPPASLQISIDGPQETHDQLRMVQGTFVKAQAGLAKLRELKEKNKSVAPLVIINSVITGDNFRNLSKVAQVAHELGATALNFQHFWFLSQPVVDAHNNLWGDCIPIDPEEVGSTATSGVDTDALWEEMQKVLRNAPLPVGFYPELTKEELHIYYNEPETMIRPRAPGCAWLQTSIFPNGDVAPCFNHIVGNIREQPFMDIWNGEKFRAHRMRLAQNGPYPVCSRCCAYFRYD